MSPRTDSHIYQGALDNDVRNPKGYIKKHLLLPRY